MRLLNNKQVGDYSGKYDKSSGEDLYIQKVLDLETLKTVPDSEKYVAYRITLTDGSKKFAMIYMINTNHTIVEEADCNIQNEKLKKFVESSNVSFEKFLEFVKPIFEN